MAERSWTVMMKDYETDETFQDAVANELVASTWGIFRMGVAVIAAPLRERIGEQYVTTGVVFKTDRVPLVGQPAPRPQTAPMVDRGADLPEDIAEAMGDAENAPEDIEQAADEDPYAAETR